MANECEKILQDGVFEHHFGKTSESKNTDYKQYFESEEFRNDFRNGKFNLGIAVVVDAVPLNLDFGSSEEQINEFVQKIKQSTNFSMSSSFYQVYQYSVANVALAAEYRKCLSEKKLGFNIGHETTDKSITFKVSYSNLDVPNPKFNEVFITPESKLRYQSIQKGEELKNNSDELFTFDLAETTKEVIFTIDTNLTAQSLKVSLGRKGQNLGLPIGTIIASFLAWDEFEKVTENNKEGGGIWKSESSYWAPCDGRAVPGSDFSKVTSSANVPELRGLFLRGLNTFDADSELGGKIPRASAEHKDPDNRTRGSYQIDDFKSHAHPFTASISPAQIRGSGGWAPENSSPSVTGAVGGVETRPKNAAVYYYIRIN
ncbi:MAG: hypothetical protein R2682_00670 [Pyrinomonadaceae bacterium]